MLNLIKALGIELSVLDFVVSGLIVAFVQKVIKEWICQKKEGQTYKIIYTVSPVILGILIYLIVALVRKLDIATSLKIGVAVGAISSWYYNAIWAYLSTKGKEKGVTAVKEIGEDIGKIVEGK